MEPDSPLRVGVVGATDRVRERVAALFDGLGEGACILVDPPAAEVLLVDLDQEGAWAAWQAHHLRAPGVPVLLLGSEPARAPAGQRFLAKPIAPALLLAELAGLHAAAGVAGVGAPAPRSSAGQAGGKGKRARQAGAGGVHAVWHTPWESTVALAPRGPDPLTERLDPTALGAETPSATDLCGDAEDVDLSDPGAVARLFVPVEERLLGACRTAVARASASGGPWVIRLAEGAIRVDDGGGAVRTDMPRQALRELCLCERLAEPAQVEPLPRDAVRKHSAERTSWESAEAFLWQVALWTYHGRLPAGTAVHGRVYLARWPNLTRIAEVPHAARVASLWLAQAVSLAFTVEVLAVPQRYVFAFYGAAHAAGLAGQARRASDHLFQPEPPGSVESRPLLAGVSARLRGLVGR